MTSSVYEIEKELDDDESLLDMIDRELRVRFPSDVDGVKIVFVREQIDREIFASMTEKDIDTLFGDFSFGVRKRLLILAENRLACKTNGKQAKITLKQMKKFVFKKLKKGAEKGRKLAKKSKRIIKLMRQNQYVVIVGNK